MQCTGSGSRCSLHPVTASVRPIHGIAVNIIINGLGVAGPTLAYWLTQSGHDVVLVEKAPSLRAGGYIIDFWGIGDPYCPEERFPERRTRATMPQHRGAACPDGLWRDVRPRRS